MSTGKTYIRRHPMLMEVLSIVRQLIELYLYLLIIVVIHEFGHYAVAQYFKMAIVCVQVGTGPEIFTFTHNGVKYQLFLWPLLGAITVLFLSKKKYRNLTMFAGGSVANIIFSITVFWFTNLNTLAEISLLIAFINLIPIRKKIGTDFDGYQILREFRTKRSQTI